MAAGVAGVRGWFERKPAHKTAAEKYDQWLEDRAKTLAMDESDWRRELGLQIEDGLRDLIAIQMRLEREETRAPRLVRAWYGFWDWVLPREAP